MNSNNPIQYFLLIDGQQKGPYTQTQLQSMWRAGTITGNINYWFEGQAEWMALSTISELLEPEHSKLPGFDRSQPIIQANAKKPFGRRVVFGLLFLAILLTIIGGVVVGLKVMSGAPSSDHAGPTKVNKVVLEKTSEFEVEYTKVLSGPNVGCDMVDVVFKKKKPSPADVDKVVRTSLEKAIAIDPSTDILAMAFLNDDALGNPSDYSGPLVWRAREKAIRHMD